MSSAQMSSIAQAGEVGDAALFCDHDALGVVEHGRPETDAELHGDGRRRRNAHSELNLPRLQRAESLRLGGKSMNGKPFRVAENGDGHGAADLAAKGGEIAVDILSVPIVDALNRAAIEMARSLDRRQRLRVRRGGEQ